MPSVIFSLVFITGWMGFYATLAGNGIGVVVSIFADIFKRRMKAFVLLLYILSAGRSSKLNYK